MKSLLLITALFIISTSSSKAQNIFQKIHERNKAHEKMMEENAKQYQQQKKLQEEIIAQSHNPGTTLYKAGNLLMTGLIVQTASAGVGGLMIASDTKKESNAGYYVIGAGALIGFGLEIAGYSKIMKAGKQFEVRFGVN